MKKILLKKHLNSFSRQGFAENLLPVSKRFKKKLVKDSQSNAFAPDQGRNSKLETTISTYLPLIQSKRIKIGQERLLSQFLNKQKDSTTIFSNRKPEITSLPFSLAYSLPLIQHKNQNLQLKFASKSNPTQDSMVKKAIDFARQKPEKVLSIQDENNDQRFLMASIIQKLNRVEQSVDTLFSVDQIKNQISFKETQKKDYSHFLYQIRECKKIRYLYGNLSKKELKKIAIKARQLPGTTADNLLILLESRLDCILYRCAFFSSIRTARQYITHKGVIINCKKVFNPSYQLSPGDIIRLISVKDIEKKLKKNYLKDAISTKTNKDNIEMNGKEEKEFFPELLRKQPETSHNLIINTTQKQAFFFLFFKQNSTFSQDVLKNFIFKLNNTLASAKFNLFDSSISPVLYKNYLLFSQSIFAIASIPNFLNSKSKEPIKKQIQKYTNPLKDLTCSQFISLLLPNIPNTSSRKYSIYRDSDNKYLEANSIVKSLPLKRPLNEDSNNIIKDEQVEKNKVKVEFLAKDRNQQEIIISKQITDIQFKQKLIKSNQKEHFSFLKTEKETKNNGIKKIFSDIACLINQDKEGFLLSNFAQGNNFALLQSIFEKTKKADKKFTSAIRILEDLLQLFVFANKNISKKNSISSREEKNNSVNELYKKLVILTKKCNAYFAKQIEKQQVKFQNYSSAQRGENIRPSNLIISLLSSSQFFLYILLTHLLHIQKRILFFSTFSKKRQLEKNKSSTNQNNFLEEIKLNTGFTLAKSTTFYQKRSKALHVEVSYHSLSAIFLYPPQKIYLPVIIDSNIIVKTLLRSKSR